MEASLPRGTCRFDGYRTSITPVESLIRGEVRAQFEVTDDMMPGVVCLPHGFGHDEDEVRLDVARARQPGANANALTDDQSLDAPSGTSVVNGVPVAVFAA